MRARDLRTLSALDRIDPMYRWIVSSEGSDWTRGRISGLEADRHSAKAGSPDPATAVLIMLDVKSRRPTSARQLCIRLGMIFDHLIGRNLHRAIRRKEILLQDIGQPGNANTKKSDSSCDVHGSEQGAGNRADDIGAVGGIEQRS